MESRALVRIARLTREKLASMRRVGATRICHLGGLNPPEAVPFSLNQEIFRLFQFGLAADFDQALHDIAARQVGAEEADDLARAWLLLDQAVRHFMPFPLNTGFGTVWLRLLVRPLVPGIEAIPAAERAYYERFMVGSGHSPNIVDLARNVLFELVPVDYACRGPERIDARSMPPLVQAIDLMRSKLRDSRLPGDEAAGELYRDQCHRARALKCLFETQRNAAAWICGVHTFLRGGTSEARIEARRLLWELPDCAKVINTPNTREHEKGIIGIPPCPDFCKPVVAAEGRITKVS